MAHVARMAALACSTLLIGAGPADDGTWLAGGYSFSDELGGFRIIDVAGNGTRGDPVVLVQELYSPAAVVMVVRAVGPRPDPSQSARAGMALYLQVETVNASGLAWVEFSHELQVHLGQPSTYSDGLSFDQAQRESGTIISDAFAAFSRDYEPSDRIVFRDGKVDPGETASFWMLVTDLTPTYQFHLVQDPRIPFS